MWSLTGDITPPADIAVSMAALEVDPTISLDVPVAGPHHVSTQGQ